MMTRVPGAREDNLDHGSYGFWLLEQKMKRGLDAVNTDSESCAWVLIYGLR